MKTDPPPEPSEGARPGPQLDFGLLVSRLWEGKFLSRCVLPVKAAQDASAPHISEQGGLHQSPGPSIWGLGWGRGRKRETI